MEYKHSIGTKVTVRKDLMPDEYYGDCYFNRDMMPLKGQQGVITDYYENSHRYRLDIGNGWVFSDEMFIKTHNNLSFTEFLTNKHKEDR